MVAGPLLLIVTTVTFAALGARMGWTRSAASGLILAAGFLLTIWSVETSTRWSLHPFYRRQLAGAYMLEREVRGDGVSANPPRPDVPIYISNSPAGGTGPHRLHRREHLDPRCDASAAQRHDLQLHPRRHGR